MVNKTYYLKDYPLNGLDKLVIKFLSILKKYTDYVVVSGYISIVFGNSRPTIDIDVLFNSFTKENWQKFVKELEKNDFEFIDDPKYLYDVIEVKKEKTDIFDKNSDWYFDFKKAKSSYDRISIEQSDYVVFDNSEKVKISPIEFQIVYKVALLGSDKDFKDATYLYNYFKNDLDLEKMKEFAELLNADLSLIGVKV